MGVQNTLRKHTLRGTRTHNLEEVEHFGIAGVGEGIERRAKVAEEGAGHVFIAEKCVATEALDDNLSAREGKEGMGIQSNDQSPRRRRRQGNVRNT